MQIGEILHQVGTESMPVVLWEEGDMVEVYALSSLQEDTHQSLRVCNIGGERSGYPLPLVVGHGNDLLVYHIILRVYYLHTELSLLAIDEMQASIYREVILHVLLQSHAEEATVLKASLLLTSAGSLQSYIVRIAREGWLHIANGYITKCIPTHQALWELERAVFHHLGIETTIGTKVDILEEDTIHGRLNFYSRLVGLYVKLMLSVSTE